MNGEDAGNEPRTNNLSEVIAGLLATDAVRQALHEAVEIALTPVLQALEEHVAEGRPRLLDVAGVARKLGTSKKTVYRLRAAGEMPAPLPLPAYILRWREDVIDEWIDTGVSL